MYKHNLQRTTRCKRFEDDSAVNEGASFDRKSKFQIETFNVVINKLISCLGHRLDAYKHLCDLFGVRFMPETISDSEVSLTFGQKSCTELIHFRSYIRPDGLNMPPSNLPEKMVDCGLQSMFPNVYTEHFVIYH